MDTHEAHAMCHREPVRSRGFTLIELLAVIAIITLLLGVLVPSVTAVRNAAKARATEVRFKDIGQGCEAFHADFDEYPRSSGQNPFESAPNARLSGAQWLLLQLVGADYQGYVNPDRRNDTDGDGKTDPDPDDWRRWYDPTNATQYTRQTLYIDMTNTKVETPERAASELGLTLPDELTTGSTNWKTERLAYVLDGFGYPVLYYRANAQAKAPFSIWSGASEQLVGRYDPRDNEAFTGCKDSGAEGWDRGEGVPMNVGAMYELGWDDGNPFVEPPQKTFAAALYDRSVFQNTPGLGADQGQVWPHRPDAFILLSAGKDGLYGTVDDVKNYQQ